MEREGEMILKWYWKKSIESSYRNKGEGGVTGSKPSLWWSLNKSSYTKWKEHQCHWQETLEGLFFGKRDKLGFEFTDCEMIKGNPRENIFQRIKETHWSQVRSWGVTCKNVILKPWEWLTAHRRRGCSKRVGEAREKLYCYYPLNLMTSYILPIGLRSAQVQDVRITELCT